MNFLESVGDCSTANKPFKLSKSSSHPANTKFLWIARDLDTVTDPRTPRMSSPSECFQLVSCQLFGCSSNWCLWRGTPSPIHTSQLYPWHSSPRPSQTQISGQWILDFLLGSIVAGLATFSRSFFCWNCLLIKSLLLVSAEFQDFFCSQHCYIS